MNRNDPVNLYARGTCMASANFGFLCGVRGWGREGGREGFGAHIKLATCDKVSAHPVRCTLRVLGEVCVRNINLLRDAIRHQMISDGLKMLCTGEAVQCGKYHLRDTVKDIT